MEKQELVITDLQFEDAGLYECRGYNGKKTFSIREEEKDLIVF
jgi:hypothetical protein